MLVLRSLLAFALATCSIARPHETRQTTNTNAQANDVIDALSVQIHKNIPAILTLQASHQATDGTVGVEMQQMVTAFTNAATDLLAIPVSSGSTTDKPTNDDISITFSDIMQQVSTGLSGLTTTMVPTFTAMISQLDPQVAATATALNTTVPNTLALVHRMMLDASQFLVKEGAWPATLAVLGF